MSNDTIENQIKYIRLEDIKQTCFIPINVKDELPAYQGWFNFMQEGTPYARGRVWFALSFKNRKLIQDSAKIMKQRKWCHLPNYGEGRLLRYGL